LLTCEVVSQRLQIYILQNSQDIKRCCFFLLFFYFCFGDI